MVLKKVILFLCIVFINMQIIVGNSTATNLKLELVQVLFRHGARTPLDCELKYLTYANASLYEPWGYAQLTNEGMMQEFKIGQMLRDRYDGFLPRLYNVDDVYAYASGIRRTKASLQLALAGLYPPDKKLIWNDNLLWMPIPIFSNPWPMDILVKSRDCPNFKEALAKLLESTEIKVIGAKHDEILQMMIKIYKRQIDLQELFCVYNAVAIHKNMNLSLPDWYDDKIYAKLINASKFHLETLSYTETLKRLNGGPLVRRFVENLRNSNFPSNRRKIYLYSAHDKTLDAFIKSHNLTTPIIPDYGSSVILEKFRDKQNKVYVKLLVWIGEPKKLITMKLKNCAELCPIDEYLKMIKPVLPSDEEMLCLYKNLTPKDIENIFNTDVKVSEFIQ